jgi:hypothetical protein
MRCALMTSEQASPRQVKHDDDAKHKLSEEVSKWRNNGHPLHAVDHAFAQQLVCVSPPR